MSWFHHKQHGYMLLQDGYAVTSLCLDTATIEESADLWEAHKSRLHVNGGCGAIAVDEFDPANRAHCWAPIQTKRVPLHIRKDFTEALL